MARSIVASRLAMAVAVESAAVVAFVYGLVNRDPQPRSIGLWLVVAICVGAVQVGLGYWLGWWSLPLALLFPLLAIPAGRGTPDDDLTIAFIGLIFYMPVSLLLLCLGAWLRDVVEGRRGRFDKLRWEVAGIVLGSTFLLIVLLLRG